MMGEMKKQIVEDLKKAREVGDITAKQIKEIVQDAVSKTTESVGESVGSIGDIAKEATFAAINEIEKAENAVLNVKLKYAEILGIMQKTVKDAVKQAIATGKDVEQTVANVTKETTEKALAQTRFSAEKIKDVSQAVLLASVEAAEEAERKRGWNRAPKDF